LPLILEKKVVVVVLYKKGSPDDVRNYRPISVTGVDYKIQSRMLTSRLNKVLPQFISKDQVGFMHGRLIHENITIVQSMLDAGPEGGGVHFSDFAAAFPSLPHNFIHELLVALNFPTGFRKMVRVYHEDIEGTIKVNGGVGGHFKMNRGVKQGFPMAPLLFNLVIECFIREVASRIEGLEMEGHFIKIRAFADDCVYFTKNANDAAALSLILQEWERDSQMSFAPHKSFSIGTRRLVLPPRGSLACGIGTGTLPPSRSRRDAKRGAVPRMAYRSTTMDH
jgi:hypothetical protein